MKCPECQIKMDEVKTSSHYGIPIVIDQCGNCGGLWFDDTELYRTQHGVAQRISKKLNEGKLRKLSDLQNQSLVCPRDGATLKQFNGWPFPASIKVEMCSKCSGFWFNHGEFNVFQNFRNNKIKPTQKSKDKELSEKTNLQVVNLLKLYSGLERENKKKRNRSKIETFFYIIWILLRILLRK